VERPFEEIVAAFEAVLREGSIERAAPYLAEDVVLDWTNSVGPYRGVYRGLEGAQRFFETVTESFAQAEWEASEPLWLGDRVAMGSRINVRGSASGVEVTGAGGQVWAFAGDKVTLVKLYQSRPEAVRDMRAQRLAEARLYFVTDALGGAQHARPIVEAALEGGADIIQLRDRELSPEGLAQAAAAFRQAASAAGALFLVNDDPALAGRFEADGVHVGQDDAGVAEARRAVGEGALVGLSTHSPEQLAGATAAEKGDRPDYVSVGPVWETPTKPGRPAAGLDYVRHAAANAALPWFAIGGIDGGNIEEVASAGAERVVVVRAIRDAADPRAAAGALRDVLVKSS
jgi:thiamine-phosphate pyrophosphorylase